MSGRKTFSSVVENGSPPFVVEREISAEIPGGFAPGGYELFRHYEELFPVPGPICEDGQFLRSNWKLVPPESFDRGSESFASVLGSVAWLADDHYLVVISNSRRFNGGRYFP